MEPKQETDREDILCLKNTCASQYILKLALYWLV